MDEFLFNVKYGINHVLDINGYDHVLFLMVLTVPYAFKSWRRVLLLVSLFTLGHTLSLVLAAYNVVTLDGELVEFLIPVTIAIAALYNVFTAGKGADKGKVGVLSITTVFFGLIHGLGFAREFQVLLGMSESKLLLLIEFALGIEIAQVIIVFVVLLLSFIANTFFTFSKRDWVLVVSSIVIGLVIPMLLSSDFLN